MIFGELVPKSLALQYPTPSALYTLPAMVASLWIYRPFIKWLNGSGLLLLRLLGAPQQAHRHIHSPRRSSCSSRKAATAACSSPTSTGGCSERCASTSGRRSS